MIRNRDSSTNTTNTSNSVDQRPASGQSSAQSSTDTSSKQKKKTVFKEKTVLQWKKDWVSCEKTGDGLVIQCKACRLLGSATNVRGAVQTDPFVNGTTNVKKFAADRHEKSKHHKAAYGMINELLCLRLGNYILHNTYLLWFYDLSNFQGSQLSPQVASFMCCK